MERKYRDIHEVDTEQQPHAKRNRERLKRKFSISTHLDIFFDSAVLRQKTLDLTIAFVVTLSFKMSRHIECRDEGAVYRDAITLKL